MHSARSLSLRDAALPAFNSHALHPPSTALPAMQTSLPMLACPSKTHTHRDSPFLRPSVRFVVRSQRTHTRTAVHHSNTRTSMARCRPRQTAYMPISVQPPLTSVGSRAGPATHRRRTLCATAPLPLLATLRCSRASSPLPPLFLATRRTSALQMHSSRRSRHAFREEVGLLKVALVALILVLARELRPAGKRTRARQVLQNTCRPAADLHASLHMTLFAPLLCPT